MCHNMFNLRCVLTSARSLCPSAQSSGSVSVIHRAVCSSAVRLQEVAASAPELERKSEGFSYLPPLPDQDSPLRWNGKKFEELHIVHVKATYNNTHIQMTDSAGASLVRATCGTEGFRNIKKSTSVAAQTTGISAAAKSIAKGVKFVRVVVKGLGPGRMAAIQGLKMGGLRVVSITDNTPVPHNGCRPRKPRRL